MSVDKISFTQYIPSNKCEIQGYTSFTIQPQNNVVTGDITSIPNDSYISRNKSDNTQTRNIVLGLAAIVGLAGLFYAGRKGHLGEKIQNFLGGIKKPQDLPTERTPDLPDINSGKKPDVNINAGKKESGTNIDTDNPINKASKIEDEASPIEEPTPEFTPNKEPEINSENDILKTEEELEVIENNTAKTETEISNIEETPVNNESATLKNTVTDNPEKEIISKGLSEAEIKAIDASLDHTIPIIPDKLRHIDIPDVEDIRCQILEGSGISPSDDIRRYIESGRYEKAPRTRGGFTYSDFSNRYVIDLPNGEKLAIYADIMYGGWRPHPQPKGIAKYSINALKRLDKDGNDILSIDYFSGGSVEYINIGNKTYTYSYNHGLKNSPTGAIVKGEANNNISEIYHYNKNNLRRVTIEDEETKIVKDVYYNKETGEIQAIVYTNGENLSDRKKLEIFDNGKLVKEIYNPNESEEREAIGFYESWKYHEPIITESGVRIDYSNLTKEEIQKIDSLFDISVPEITEEIAHHKLPDINLAKQEMVEGSELDPENFVDYVDFSKCVKVPRKVKNITYDDFVYRYTIDLPNDEKIAIEVADFDKFKTFDGKPIIHSVRRLDKDGNEIFSIDYYSRSEITNINRGDVHYAFEHGGKEMIGFQYQNGNNTYCYSVDGNLKRFIFNDPQNKTEKEIAIDSGTGKISHILYKKFVGKYNVPQIVRHDFFDNGKLSSISYNK